MLGNLMVLLKLSYRLCQGRDVLIWSGSLLPSESIFFFFLHFCGSWSPKEKKKNLKCCSIYGKEHFMEKYREITVVLLQRGIEPMTGLQREWTWTAYLVKCYTSCPNLLFCCSLSIHCSWPWGGDFLLR